jgi:hypothetical protein
VSFSKAANRVLIKENTLENNSLPQVELQELEGRLVGSDYLTKVIFPRLLLLIVIRMNLMHRLKFEIRIELQPVLSPAIICKNNFSLGIRFWLLPTIQPDNLPLLSPSQKRKKTFSIDRL